MKMDSYAERKKNEIKKWCWGGVRGAEMLKKVGGKVRHQKKFRDYKYTNLYSAPTDCKRE